MDDSQNDEDCFVIPFSGDDETSVPSIPPIKPTWDVENGGSLRYAAYERVWTRLSERTRTIEQKFNSSLAAELTAFVESAYDYSSFGPPPQPTIPTAAVVGRSPTISFDRHHVCRLAAKDCTNIANAMKCLILGFLAHGGITNIADDDEEDEGPNVQKDRSRTAGPTLANYDIGLLEAWYKRGSLSESKLVVIISDVESFAASVLEMVFYICRSRIATLPFIFILGISTSVEYLHQTLRHSTLTCLELTPFRAAGGDRLFAEAVESLFLDPDFELGVVFGPRPLELIQLQFRKQSGSLDGVLSTMQLLLLQHFSRPLSVLALEDHAIPPEELPVNFVQHLRARLAQGIERDSATSPLDDERGQLLQNVARGDVKTLLTAVEWSREQFFDSLRGFHISFGLLWAVQASLKGSTRTNQFDTLLLLQSGGEEGVYFKELSEKIKKLSIQDLHALVKEAEAHIETLSDEDQSNFGVDDLLKNLVRIREDLEDEAVEKESAPTASASSAVRIDLTSIDAIASMGRPTEGRSRHAGDVQGALIHFWKMWLVPLSSLPLAEVWYITGGSVDSVEELLNPSIVSAVTSALMRPHGYLRCQCCGVHRNAQSESLASFPDESVAFLRYLNSGKSVNVYDWFETFAMGFEGEAAAQAAQQRSPKKKKAENGTGAKEMLTEEQEETRRNDLQARFLRCFHEFDMIGLLRHSGRKKKENVIRTVYDIADGGDE